MRPIDADVLMNQLERKRCWEINKKFLEGFNDCMLRVRSMVHSAPTITQTNEWVSVEESLPEESDGMVLFTNGRAVTYGYRNHMFRMSGEEGVYAPAIRKGGGYMRVTHWMHLPAPPDRRLPEGKEDAKDDHMG